MMRGTLGLPMILSLDIISDWLVGLAHVAVRSRECVWHGARKTCF